MNDDCQNIVPKLTLPPLAGRTPASINNLLFGVHDNSLWESTRTPSENACTASDPNADSLILDSIDLEASGASSAKEQLTARTQLPAGCCGSQQGAQGLLGFIGERSVRSMGSLASIFTLRTSCSTDAKVESRTSHSADPNPSIRKKIAETLDYYLFYRITAVRRPFSGSDPCDMSFCEAEDRLQGICRKSFAERIDLEIKMMHTLPKFCWFFLAFSIFLLIQWIEYHPENYSETHKSLRSQFKLDSEFYEIDRVHNLVSYLGDFAKAAKTFDPLHQYYWCPDQDSSPLSPQIPERIKCKKRDQLSFDVYFNGCCAGSECGTCGVANCGARCSATCGACGGTAAACGACAAGCSGHLSGCGACSGEGCGTCSGSHSSTNCSASCCGAPCGSSHANSSDASARRLMRPGVGRNTPLKHSLELSLPYRAPLPLGIQSSRSMSKHRYDVSDGVFGFAVNGVLIVGTHHKGGRKLQVTWHFDDCGGHGDSDGWYHYHFPPSCLLARRGGAGASMATWWAQDSPETYWPRRAAPSPLLGYALDGHPIYGPYGPDGKLLAAADLDACHGKFVPGPNGTQVYRYFWLVEAPFLPPCFSDAPGHVNWNVAVGDPCPNEDASGSVQHHNSIVSDAHSRLVMKSTSCPDHAYFRNSLRVQRVDPSLEERLSDQRHLGCCASSEDGCGTLTNTSGSGAIDIFNPCAAGFGEEKPPPPESYRRFHPFSMITASVMPPLLWQTRFEPIQCKSSFAREFNNQSTNPSYNAPLDAPRKDPLIRCRSTTLSKSRHLGYAAVGEDEPRYSVFLTEAIMRPMKDYDWIDDMTDSVTLALLLYTPGREDLSLLRLNFKLRPSGRIHPTFVLTTHSTFNDRDDFGYWLALNILFLVVTLFRVIMSVRDLWVNAWLDDKKSMRRFDALLAVVFLTFSGITFVRRLFVCSLLEEVIPLIESFYGVADIQDSAQVDQTLSKYFKVLTLVMERVNEEEILKLIAYFIIIISILRLIGYMSVHPRIAVLSQTLASASDNIFHFMLVFCLISGLLAWLACWSFGPDKDLFSTLQYALFTQLKMVMGEFPFDDPWKETVLERLWYVCYAILIFFLAVNIFLSIIVEAFMEVKKRLAEEVLVERNLPVDFLCLIRYWLLGQSMDWPSRLAVARHLKTTRHFRGAVNSKELRSSKFLNFKSRLEAQLYLDFYYSILGETILSKQGREYVTMKHQQKETHRCLVVLFNVSQVQMENSAWKIQQCWHRHRKRKQELVRNAKESARSATRRPRISEVGTRSTSSDSGIAGVGKERSSESLNVSKAISVRSLPSLLSRVIEQQKSNGSFSSIGDEFLQETEV